MERQKLIGVILLILGGAVFIVSMLADVIGYGGSPNFGYKQIAGTVVGGLVFIIGIILAIRKPITEG